MDAMGHAVITAAVSDSPLAIVASAMKLQYSVKGVEALRHALPLQYAPMAAGVESHIAANNYTHNHRIFLEMRRAARPVLANSGIRDIFSHLMVEAAIDCLLMEENDRVAPVREAWAAFDWKAAHKYLPLFSRDSERAKRTIEHSMERLDYDGIAYAAGWLGYVMKRNGNTPPDITVRIRAMKGLAGTLRNSNYQELIQEAQQELVRIWKNNKN